MDSHLLEANPIWSQTCGFSLNELLTDSVRFITQEQLAIAQAELCQVDRDLALLSAKRVHLTNRIGECMVVLAPHKKLPPEILSRIFTFLVSPPAFLPLIDKSSNVRLRLTQICSAWRRIAFATPQLWYLAFSHSPQNSTSTSRSFELANAWLTQCSFPGLSLTVPFEYIAQSLPQDRAPLDNLITRVVAPHSQRLKRLHTVSTGQGVSALLSLPAESFGSLFDFSLKIVGAYPQLW
jgi:hypothetical protein